MDDIPACVSPVNMSQIKDIPVFQDLTLEDPDYSCNCRLHLLLGMVHCNLCSQDGTVFSMDKACKAEKTIFGWAIGGSPQFSSFSNASLIKFNNFYGLAMQLQIKFNNSYDFSNAAADKIQ